MKSALLVSALVLFSVPAHAGGAQKICFDNGGVADYRADGSYQYDGGGTFTGKWKSVGKNRYQINFDSGGSRVDTYDDLVGGKVLDHAPKGDFPATAADPDTGRPWRL